MGLGIFLIFAAGRGLPRKARNHRSLEIRHTAGYARRGFAEGREESRREKVCLKFQTELLPSPACGRGVGGEGAPYLLQHALQLLHNIVIPETQYRITLVAQPRIPLLVIDHPVGMLATVNLDDQPVLQTHKIHDVAAYGFLALEFQTHEAMRPQVNPEPLLGFSSLLKNTVFQQTAARSRDRPPFFKHASV